MKKQKHRQVMQDLLHKEEKFRYSKKMKIYVESRKKHTCIHTYHL